MSFGFKNVKIFHFWHQVGFPDLKILILRAIECLNVTLGKIFHGMSHENWFTTSTAYKVGLKSPILAEKSQNIVIFCLKLDFQIPKI